MLVLQRHRGESIMIGADITIQVVDIRGPIVRIGVEAPKDVKVDREEVRRKIEREGEPQ